MDNHPIPQDVTGFQFKLIGNMTVKQFAYLATGVVSAWILWQLPINGFLKFPFCAILAILGIGLAYFPIGGRPMDVMIGNYIKALLRPTQFVYEKNGGQIYFPNRTPLLTRKSTKQYVNELSPFPKDKLKAYLESSSVKSSSAPYQSNIVSDLNLPQVQISIQPGSLKQTDSPKPVSMPETVAVQPTAAVRPASPNRGEPASPKPQPDEQPHFITPPIKFATLRNASFTKPAIKLGPEDKRGTVIIPTLKKPSKPLGVPSVPDTPNLITGITKDARGNALPNILVEVRDKDDSPVRAFKTNEFGRFASATPLINGAYTLAFEDPKAQNKFEKMTIQAVGQAILPIEAVSIDTREELRRSLFTPAN